MVRGVDMWLNNPLPPLEASGTSGMKAAANGVPVSLVHRVIMRESRYNARAVTGGNYGLMQIRLGTARAMGYGGSAAGLRPDSKRNREFLEQFSLDTLKMVGTLKLSGQMFGLVQTKDGLVHRVTPGNYMGQADGKIADITPSKISVVEIVPDGLGGYMERRASLGLNE